MRVLRPQLRNFAPVISLLAIIAPSRAQTPSLRTIIPSGLSQPLFVTAAPGDNNRLFILEKTGAIRIFDKTTNTLLTNPYLTIPVNTTGERGLLGLAFDPNFASNGRFYVDYARNSGVSADIGDLVIA